MRRIYCDSARCTADITMEPHRYVLEISKLSPGDDGGKGSMKPAIQGRELCAQCFSDLVGLLDTLPLRPTT